MADLPQHPVAWNRLDVSNGTGIGALIAEPDGYRLEGSEVVFDKGLRYSCRFTVRTDLAWVTREVRLETLSGAGARTVRLSAQAARWKVDGVRAPELDGCLDVDVASIPLTNTLPIRRLGLSPRQSREVAVVGVDVPGLGVHRSGRRYSRLPASDGVDRYECGDPVNGAFTMSVDHEGLAIDFEGFAERLG